MIGRALSWWGRSLGALVPQSVRRAIEPKRRALYWDDRIDGFTDQELRAQLRGRGRKALRVHLPLTLAPRRKVSLPGAAAGYAESALALQMERLTPFKATELLISSRTASSVDGGERLLVECAITPRALATTVREQIADNGGDVAQIVSGSGNQILTLWERPTRKLVYLPALIFIATAIGLVAGVALQRIEALEERRDWLQSRVALERREAIKSQSARRDLEKISTEADYVKDQLTASGSRLELVNELARRLGDDTWLTSLSFDGNKIRLSGFSTAAQSLIAVLERSPKMTNVTFASSTIRDPRVEADRLELAAEIVRPLQRGN